MRHRGGEEGRGSGGPEELTFPPSVIRQARGLRPPGLFRSASVWWFGLPAILKGRVDRVFAMGWAYGGGKIYETGPFRGKRAFLSLTTGGPQASYAKGGFNGDLDGILLPVQRGILRFRGFEVLAPHVVFGPLLYRPWESRRDPKAGTEAAWPFTAMSVRRAPEETEAPARSAPRRAP